MSRTLASNDAYRDPPDIFYPGDTYRKKYQREYMRAWRASRRGPDYVPRKMGRPVGSVAANYENRMTKDEAHEWCQKHKCKYIQEMSTGKVRCFYHMLTKEVYNHPAQRVFFRLCKTGRCPGYKGSDSKSDQHI